MKKIKLVLSDIHLGKGRLLESGIGNPHEEFFYDDQLSEFLNYYSTGEYKDCDVELIINGDFLNFLIVDYKGFHITSVTEDISLEKLKTIINGHLKVFKSLQLFLSISKNSLTYIIGNHDQSMFWPKCRSYLNQILNHEINYKNLVHIFDGIHIEHGHMYEAMSKFNPKKFFLKKNLPEPILNMPLGAFFYNDFLIKAKEEKPYIDRVRPFYQFFRWGLLLDTVYTVKLYFKILSYFVKLLLTPPNPRNNFTLRQYIKIFKEGALQPQLDQAAKKILDEERIHTVIFGHSHVFKYRQFSENKEYFNTGTWTEVTSLDISNLGSIQSLTYVLIDYKDDLSRPRGHLKEWIGYQRVEKNVEIS